MSAPLPHLRTVTDVAEALGQSENYVRTQCRKRLWPHRRLARGAVGFTDADYAQVLELICAAPAEAEPQERFALAPRSRRAS